MKHYGVDIGYGFTKVSGVDRIARVMPSIVGSNEEFSYRSDIGDRAKITPLTLGGKSYLVGDAAKRFSRTATGFSTRRGPKAPIISCSSFRP